MIHVGIFRLILSLKWVERKKCLDCSAIILTMAYRFTDAATETVSANLIRNSLVLQKQPTYCQCFENTQHKSHCKLFFPSTS